MRIIIPLCLLAGIYLFLVWPARASDEAKAPYVRRNFAHRGLYDNASPAPENSLAAFEAAMQAGYGCELDVQFTSDKKLIVFHDNDYLRACGVDKKVWELTLEEAQQLSLFGTDQRVPTFRQVLDTVAGRQPLIVEIKAEELDMAWYTELCEAVRDELSRYDGEYCLESFHPLVMGWVRRNMPDRTRGLLIVGPPKKGEKPWLIQLGLCLLLGDALCRPHFIAYNCDRRILPLRLVQKLGAFTVMWTCRTPEHQAELEKKEDCVIFESYRPDTSFRD